jgi:peptidoglycan/LPS O-acetylase OafA/YrhL
VRYIPALDGLRAIAVGLVVAFHTVRLPGGWMGVDVFFVLSGFLITRLFVLEQERTGGISIPNFLVRRALRLMPCFWLVVVVSLIYFRFQHAPPAYNEDLRNAAFALFYMTNWKMYWFGLGGNLFGHTWSLSIEEQFYLIWAFGAVLLLGSCSLKRAVWLLGAIVAGFVAWRWMLRFSGASPERIFFGLDARTDELLSGAFLALVASSKLGVRLGGSVRSLRFVGLVGLGLLGLIAAWSVDRTGWALFFWEPICIIAAALCIVDALYNPAGMATRLLSLRWLVYLGSISYGIYLWHDVINWAVYAGRWSESRLAHLLIAGVGGIALAAISYHFMEQPILRLKSRLQFAAGGRPAAGLPAANAD